MSRALTTTEPTERVCKAGCSPDPQPVENFYARKTSILGHRFFDTICKKCTCLMARDKYKGAPLRSSGKGRTGGRQSKMKDLSGYDVTPCGLCGLRGHLPGDPERCIVGQERSTGLGGRGGNWGAL